jgi:hypothetical protein
MNRSHVMLAVAFAYLASLCIAEAQTPTGSPPPSHGALSSPLLTGYEQRVVQLHHLSFTIIVALADLQAVLPPGYVALPRPSDPTTAQVTVVIAYQDRVELPAAFNGLTAGTYGPSSHLSVEAVVRGASGDNELAILVHERSTQDSVDLIDKAFGVGSARLADSINIDIEEENEGAGTLRFKFRVKDHTIGLDIAGEANTASAIVQRTTLNPDPIPLRFLNGFTPNTLFRVGSQGDLITVLVAPGTLLLKVPGGRLNLPVGDLTILGAGPIVRLSRNLELFLKNLPGQ